MVSKESKVEPPGEGQSSWISSAHGGVRRVISRGTVGGRPAGERLFRNLCLFHPRILPLAPAGRPASRSLFVAPRSRCQ